MQGQVRTLEHSCWDLQVFAGFRAFGGLGASIPGHSKKCKQFKRGFACSPCRKEASPNDQTMHARCLVPALCPLDCCGWQGGRGPGRAMRKKGASLPGFCSTSINPLTRAPCLKTQSYLRLVRLRSWGSLAWANNLALFRILFPFPAEHPVSFCFPFVPLCPRPGSFSVGISVSL